MSSSGDSLAALAGAYVDKLNVALSRGDERLARELADSYADEALGLIAAEPEPPQRVGFAPCTAPRLARFRRLWVWTAR